MFGFPPIFAGLVFDFNLDTLGHKAKVGLNKEGPDGKQRVVEAEYSLDGQTVSKATVEADIPNHIYSAEVVVKDEVYSGLVTHSLESVGSQQKLDTQAVIMFNQRQVKLRHVMKTGWINQALVYEGNLEVRLYCGQSEPNINHNWLP